MTRLNSNSGFLMGSAGLADLRPRVGSEGDDNSVLKFKIESGTLSGRTTKCNEGQL